MFATLVLTVMLGFGAILVDLGNRRASARWEQSIADMAALAAGKYLSENDFNGACKDAITYINVNDKRLTSAINASTFCTPITNACGGSTAKRTAGPTTYGDVTVEIDHPVPAADIASSYYSGAGKNDGTSACARMSVLVKHADKSFFGAVLGRSIGSTLRAATVKPSVSSGSPPALWLLDPHGCSPSPLQVSGAGTSVTVGTTTNQGVITIDSDATDSHCSNSQTALDVDSSGAHVYAIGPPDPTSGSTYTGQINLVGLPAGYTSCTGVYACQAGQVSGGNINPQPVHGSTASRASIDWRYNCKSSYPTFHGVTITPCPYTTDLGGTNYPYIDQLKAAIGTSGTPAGFTKIQGSACSEGGTAVYTGNYYVNCTRGNNGFIVKGGGSVTFNGNVVFEDNVTVQNGGTLNINTGNATTSLSSACTTPSMSLPCTTSSSQKAAFAYIRGDEGSVFQTNSGSTVTMNHVFLYGGTGAINFSGNAPTWSAPIEGPFTGGTLAGISYPGLSYWTDMPSTASSSQLSTFTLTGGAGAAFSGLFFTPEAQPFKLTGGGDWGQVHAEFISYDLKIDGGAIIQMAPDPTGILPPSEKGFLIR